MNKAFTLVELSIVLIIVGLIVGGVLAGNAIIYRARIQNVVSQFNKYDMATQAFILRFGAIPGDFSRAVEAGIVPAGLTDPTRQGDGDGNIGNTFNMTAYEPLYFWQNLANAGLVSERTNGLGGFDNLANCASGDMSGNPHALGKYGVCQPNVKNFTRFFPTPGDAANFGIFYIRKYNNGHYFQITSSTGDLPATIALCEGTPLPQRHWCNALKPEDAFAIDNILDDGNPFAGNILAYDGSDPGFQDTSLTNQPTINSPTQGAAGSANCVNSGNLQYNIGSAAEYRCSLNIRSSF